MSLPPLPLGVQHFDYMNLDGDEMHFSTGDSSEIRVNCLLRFGHSMVSGLFEPIGHKKWPLKFHFHDFEEFVLGKDGRAYQNELRVCHLLHVTR